MQLHNLKSTHKKKKRKRIGRGGKKGTYSGRGVKGQKSRAGKRMEPIIRGWIKKYPKLRGYRNKKVLKKISVINVGELERFFSNNDIVSPSVLVKKKLIRKINGAVPNVKILGNGKITKSLIIKNCELSKKAKEKIEKTINIKN